MKQDRRSPSVSDKTFSWLMRLGVMVLAIGVATFGFMYYQDQYAVQAGPSLVSRQIEGAEAAVKKTPNNIEVRLQLAAAYMLNKRPDDALTQYDVILKADKANRSALIGRGGVLIAKGDLKAAAVSYHEITDTAAKGEFAGADTQAQEAYYYLGWIALTQDKPEVAITELNHALTIDRADSDSLYLLGKALLKEGKADMAVVALKQAVLFVPTGWCEPYVQLNLAYTKLGNAPQATYDGAMANFCHKKPAEAKAQLNTLITGPVKVDAMLGLGLIAETESSNPEAISFYQKVLKVDPKNANAISSLSRLRVAPTSTTKK